MVLFSSTPVCRQHKHLFVLCLCGVSAVLLLHHGFPLSLTKSRPVSIARTNSWLSAQAHFVPSSVCLRFPVFLVTHRAKGSVSELQSSVMHAAPNPAP